MKITLLLSSILLLWLMQSKAGRVPDGSFANEERQSSLCQKPDSSNYKIKIVKTDIGYSQVRLTIIDDKNDPLDALISLNDINQKGISGVQSNEDGKVSLMIYSDAVKYIWVGAYGYGKVWIPIEKIKNHVSDIKVQLYTFTTIN